MSSKMIEFMYAHDIHGSWINLFSDVLKDERFKEIIYELRNLKANGKTFYPSFYNIFKVFSMPLVNVNIVILGQDPYPNPDQATGLAFAVPDHYRPIPKSLGIILDTVEVDVDTFGSDLTQWHSQGIFLLNTALTVEHKSAGSHTKLWRFFTERTIQFISENRSNVVFMLWGGNAKGFEKNIMNPDEHLILKGNHPAAQCYNPANKFVDKKHFETASKYIKKSRGNDIFWTVPF